MLWWPKPALDMEQGLLFFLWLSLPCQRQRLVPNHWSRIPHVCFWATLLSFGASKSRSMDTRCGDVFAFSSLRNHISFLMFTCMHLFGSAGSPWLLGFLWLRQAGPALCGGAQASHWGGLSGWAARLQGSRAPVVWLLGSKAQVWQPWRKSLVTPRHGHHAYLYLLPHDNKNYPVTEINQRPKREDENE